MKKSTSAFSVVELVITIAVIAILAAILTASYNGVQAQARDAKRMSDLDKIADTIQLYRLKHDSDIGVGSGCGSGNNGSGWFNYENPSSTTDYTRSILRCLNDEGYLDDTFVDPSGCASTTGAAAPGYTCSNTGLAYMKYTCIKGGVTVSTIYAHLELSGDAVKTKNGGGCNAAYVVDTWGMNYFVDAE